MDWLYHNISFEKFNRRRKKKKKTDVSEFPAPKKVKPRESVTNAKVVVSKHKKTTEEPPVEKSSVGFTVMVSGDKRPCD